jgi:hypothetical protein
VIRLSALPTSRIYLRRNIRGFNSVGGQDSSIDIATGYDLDGPVIDSQSGRDFSPLGPTQPSVQWVPGLSWGYSGRGVVLTIHTLLAPRSRKSRAIPLLLSGPSGLLGVPYLYSVLLKAGSTPGHIAAGRMSMKISSDIIGNGVRVLLAYRAVSSGSIITKRRTQRCYTALSHVEGRIYSYNGSIRENTYVKC